MFVLLVDVLGIQGRTALQGVNGVMGRYCIGYHCIVRGPKCLQLIGMHAFSGCDTTSYSHDKSKISVLNTLPAGDFQHFMDVLGEEAAT